VSELDWIGCELYNLGSYWIFLLWIMDVDPFPRIGQPCRGGRKDKVGEGRKRMTSGSHLLANGKWDLENGK
jgi:hypothetical protein